MYGLVNQAIKDLVVSNYSEDIWEQICKKADSPTTDFVSLNYYEDKITYSLVGAASQILKLPAELILQLFGKHWVLYTAKNGYGPLMDMFGSNFKECLQNLNNLHSRMGMTMTQLSPPKFIFNELQSDLYLLEYQSKRSGLCPMVIGLLEGLAEKHNVKAEIKLKETDTAKLFEIKVSA